MLTRGFEPAEYAYRLRRAQALMGDAGLAALLLTTEPEVRYFTGFLTRFWESPTRPWFLVIPQSGKPVAVIPSIGQALMESTWLDDVRTWPAPDLDDDGISLLADTLTKIVGPKERVGMPAAHETHVRMPLADFWKLQNLLTPTDLTSDAGIMRQLRMQKSDAEIAKISRACEIATKAFSRVGEFAAPGVPLSTVFRRFQMTCLDEGADWVPYLAGGAGPNGYGDVISPAGDAPLADGDILMLDTGMVFDGYFCDFDRNYAIGSSSELVKSVWSQLIDATAAGFDAARPGATAADVFHAMNRVLDSGSGATDAGRLGHGLGMQLTEWPSLIPTDSTVLEEGMVLTLEPSQATVNGNLLVHEENIVITGEGARFLTQPSSHELPETRG